MNSIRFDSSQKIHEISTSTWHQHDAITPKSHRDEKLQTRTYEYISKDPTHVAIITDGNSRWANHHLQQQQHMARLISKTNLNPSFIGHSKGGNRVVSLLLHIKNYHRHIKYVTVYGFSTENWSRPQSEINDLWKVMERTIDRFRDLAIREHLLVKMVGEPNDERIPKSLRNAFRQLEIDTTENVQRIKQDNQNQKNPTAEYAFEPLTLCLAINYGGRNDILQATKRIAEMVSNQEMNIHDITQDTITNMLSTAHIPEPDLLIRTGGEQRLSNFLLWNCAYSELYFTDTLWPDFDEYHFEEALKWYHGRDRRFGGRSV